MAKPRSKTPSKPGPELGFSRLASYRLDQLAKISDRLAEMRYRRKFGLRRVHVRMIAVVGAFGPLNLTKACLQTELEKSNASRIVAQLEEKGFLLRREDPIDQRSFYLTLTRPGQKIYQELYEDAVARNEQWISALGKKQKTIFLECTEMLLQHSRKMLQEELNCKSGGESLEPESQASRRESVNGVRSGPFLASVSPARNGTGDR